MFDLPVPGEWSDIASHMKWPFDPTLQIHLEYDSYHGQIINQADVVLLQYPLMQNVSKQIAQNDAAYYQAKTDSNGYFTGDKYVYIII
jgi:trehalose/maltose hydrolase-like predicted phosphorylase